MPAKVKVINVNVRRQCPIFFGFNGSCFQPINILYFRCVFNYITRATCLLMLCSELIYERRLCGTRFPTKVKLTCVNISRHFPVIHAGFTYCIMMHEFIFSCTLYCILDRYFIFRIIPLITPCIDVWRASWVRYPTKIKIFNVFKRIKVLRLLC